MKYLIIELVSYKNSIIECLKIVNKELIGIVYRSHSTVMESHFP